MTAQQHSQQPEVKQGQLWREVDPRFKRFVAVLSVDVDAGAAIVRNASFETGKGRTASLQRFNGRRGGYCYIADRADCSQCGEKFDKPACGPTHASIQASMR